MADLNVLDRYGPFLAMIQIGLLCMAIRFGAIVMNGGSPITPEIYGPAVYAFPAIGWAAIQAGASLIAFLGLAFRKPVFIILGAAPNVALQSIFYALSGMADQGTLLQTGTFFITLPICLVTLWSGVERVYHEWR